jgi:hypothetical protein
MNRRIVGALATVALGASLIAGIGLYVSSAKGDTSILDATPAGTLDTPQGKLPHYTMDLSIYPDNLFKPGSSHPDWVGYGPSTNFRVPSHSAITFTMKQYDSGEPITNDFFARVAGTMNGTINIGGKDLTSVDPSTIGHTFTIRGISTTGKNNLFINVPMPMVAEEKMSENEGEYINPTIVTFTIITGDAGKYVWNCEFPCGDGTYARFGGPMSSQGFMSGYFIVADK